MRIKERVKSASQVVRAPRHLSLPGEKKSRLRNSDGRLRPCALSNRRRNRRQIAIDWTYYGKHCSDVGLLS